MYCYAVIHFINFAIKTVAHFAYYTLIVCSWYLQEDSDREWKFARSLLYMDYIGNGGTLPAPLNIIGAPKALLKLIFCSCSCCSSDVESSGDGTFVLSCVFVTPSFVNDIIQNFPDMELHIFASACMVRHWSGIIPR